MPKSRRSKPLYQRGQFRLDRRADREQLVITWYDPAKRRERGISAGTDDTLQARAALDRLYLESQGQTICPTCGHSTNEEESPLVITAIAEYLNLKRDAQGVNGIRARLDHVHAYMDAYNLLSTRCQQIDEVWIENFRNWMRTRPVVSSKGKIRERAISTTENSVLQLAAVINAMDRRGARFKPASPKSVNRSPVYRADIETLAKMFSYALEPKKKRESLLAFLRLSVLTLGRPDAVLEASLDPELAQWENHKGLFNLNPTGRRQTRKYRASVPVARQGIPWLNSLPAGPIIKANTIKTAWNRMSDELGLPGEGEAGSKLIRRSMAELMREMMMAAHQDEVAVFLGQARPDSVAGINAPVVTDYLAHAKEAVENVIDRLEALAPGAFSRTVTAGGTPEGVVYSPN